MKRKKVHKSQIYVLEKKVNKLDAIGIEVAKEERRTVNQELAQLFHKMQKVHTLELGQDMQA